MWYLIIKFALSIGKIYTGIVNATYEHYSIFEEGMYDKITGLITLHEDNYVLPLNDANISRASCGKQMLKYDSTVWSYHYECLKNKSVRLL